MARKTTKPQAEAAQEAAVDAVETVETVETVEAAEPQAENIQTEEKVAEPAQEEPKKTPGRKRGPRKDAAKKDAAKKEAVKAEAAKAEVKAETKAGRKPAQHCNLYVQYGGKSLSEEELVKIARDVWKYDLKRKVTELKSVDLYVKPEENRVYYVMNKEFTGSFAI